MITANCYRRSILLFVLQVFAIQAIFAQQRPPVTKVLENALGAVVTVGVFETDMAKKTLGFRGNPVEQAYAKMLDLSGASGSGSGFFIRYNNRTLVITNAHVIEQAADKEGSIYVYTINRSKYEAKIVGGDSFYDLAVLELVDKPGDEVSFLEIRQAPALVGEPVYAVGNPLGEYPYSVSEGIISAKNRVRGGLTGKFGFLQTTATVIWGNSGGPLLDAEGKVLGVNSQIAFADRGGSSIWQPQINFALEAGITSRLINDILTNNGVVGRSYLGIELMQRKLPFQPGTKEYTYYSQKFTPDTYPVLNKVLDGAPAAALKPYIGQQVVKVNGEPTRNIEEVLGELEKSKPNQKIEFTFQKDGQKTQVSVNAGALSSSGSASLGKWFMQMAGARYVQDENMLSLNFTGGEQNGQSLDFAAARGTQAAGQEAPLTGEWLVLGVGIYRENYESLWRINDIADVGTAARLTGTSGNIDMVLFKKGGQPGVAENYKIKKISISGTSYIQQQTLWY